MTRYVLSALGGLIVLFLLQTAIEAVTPAWVNGHKTMVQILTWGFATFVSVILTTALARDSIRPAIAVAGVQMVLVVGALTAISSSWISDFTALTITAVAAWVGIALAARRLMRPVAET